MTRVKICGITNLEHALHAVRCGADALRFIFVPGTPRFIGESAKAMRIPREIPAFVTRVAVVRELHEVGEMFDAIQYYENQMDAPVVEQQLIRVIRLRDDSSLKELADSESQADAIMLDAFHSEKLGG